jgi:hypothetical protein
VIKPAFDAGWAFSEGLACVTVRGVTGFVDANGSMVIAPQFDSKYGCYNKFHDGVSSISVTKKIRRNGKLTESEKWGFVDAKGKITFLPGITFLSDFREGLAFFRKGGLVGYVNRDFKIVIKPQFKSAGDFYFGRARADDIDGKKYYIDKTGRRLFENKNGGEFQDRKAFFKSKGKYGFIDLSGRVIIPPTFEKANHFGEGLAGVRVGTKWGFVDARGIMSIAPQFDNVGVFSEGLVSVELNGKWGFADRSGAIVIAPQFDKWTYYFENGLCEVHLDGKRGYIDKTGNFVWPLTN